MRLKTMSGLLTIIALFILSAPPQLYSASVQLSWQPNVEPDLHGYYIYYGTQSRKYGSPVPVVNDTTYTIDGLEEDVVYYYAVSAVDNAGNESGFSEEISELVSSSDTQPPTIRITTPTRTNNYTTDSSMITLSGKSDDDHGLKLIAWANSAGNSGLASGTNKWTIEDLQLSRGTNLITVTAIDISGNQNQDTLTITCLNDDKPVELEVSAWWTRRKNRSKSVPIKIYDGQRLLDTVYVNQRDMELRGQWNKLGVYSFTEAPRVVVIALPDTGTTCADAMRISYAGKSIATIDNGDPGTSYTGKWTLKDTKYYYGAKSEQSKDGEYTFAFNLNLKSTILALSVN